MQISIKELKELIREAFGTHTMYIPTSQDIAAKKSDIKYGTKPEEWSSKSDEMFDAEVEEMSRLPEFESIEDFVKSKLDNDEYEFTTAELRALVLGTYNKTGAGVNQDSVKRELTSIGLKFVPREPVKHSRGFGAPVHGSNRYAGNAAGSGTASGGWIGIGGGQGMLGGGGWWSSSDPKSLGMGAKHR
jgi:hypothetical protein